MTQKKKIKYAALILTLLLIVGSVTAAVVRETDNNLDQITGGTYYYSGDFDFYTNSHFYTTNKIQNSKGLLVNASQANFLTAFYDLNSTYGGWVQVPYNFSYTMPATNPYNIVVRDPGKIDTHEAYTWVIYRDATYIYLKNCSSGRLEMKSTNATTIFRYAITHPAGGDVSIYVRDGGYVFTAPLPIVTHLRITGDTVTATQLILANTANCNLFEYSDSTLIYFFTLMHLGLACSSTWANATAIKTNNKVCDGLMFDVFVSGFNGTNGAGIDLGTTWGWRITQCVFEFNRDGMKIHGGSNGQIVNNKISQNWGHGINLTASQACIVNGNYISSNGKAGINLQDGSTKNIISCNLIGSNNRQNTVWADIFVTWAYRNNYVENRLMGDSTSKYNIYISYGHNDTFYNNYCQDAVTASWGQSSYYASMIDAREVVRNNFGVVTEKWGNTSVANNGTITHTLQRTPTTVLVTCQNWNLTAQVTMVNSTVFRVSIRNLNTGLPPGGSYMIYWVAKTFQ